MLRKLFTRHILTLKLGSQRISNPGLLQDLILVRQWIKTILTASC